MLIDKEKCTKCGDCILACPSGAIELIGKWYSKDELLEEVAKDTPFYNTSGGGVTFGGSKPMAQMDFLKEVLPELKRGDIHIANRYVRKRTMEEFRRNYQVC